MEAPGISSADANDVTLSDAVSSSALTNTNVLPGTAVNCEKNLRSDLPACTFSYAVHANTNPMGVVPGKVLGQKKGLQYTERITVRVVVTNVHDQIMLLKSHPGFDDYYKLPGGCIKAHEDYRKAGAKEATKEAGCKIMIVGDCFAMTEEWRNDEDPKDSEEPECSTSRNPLHAITHCYHGLKVDKAGFLGATTKKVDTEPLYEWMSVHTALEKLTKCEPQTENGQYTKERDLFFLEAILGRMTVKPWKHSGSDESCRDKGSEDESCGDE